MFSKILIANRGEIALRVARTARRLGVATVAVFSEADRDAMHVEACDEAVFIGAAAARDSYLDADRILKVACQCGAEAIHPGYGFLSENAAFAQACEAADIVFIGPPADAIEAMGSKSQAKALMRDAGVPLVPGYHGDAQDEGTLFAESQKIGYPQLIKASAGGGGKGMRVVEDESQFVAALASAKREAVASFGDDRMLIERYLRRPRHIELQIFADGHGNCVHLFERDCSIQRRHQKVLEEAPAAGITRTLRTAMGDAAIQCAAAIGYVGAGTVEFLLDQSGEFYFMEMNTRLQVEHPVTEMITGLDLVEWQLHVAAGGALPLQQHQIEIDGHAIEARIYAEIPEKGFLPASGQILLQHLPSTGAGVRVDTGVRDGDVIGIYYDPMIAKLIVHAADREQALARMAQSLRQYRILGLGTNIAFLERVVTQPELLAAAVDTHFIEQHQARLLRSEHNDLNRGLIMAAAVTAPMFDSGECGADAWDECACWRLNLPPRYQIMLTHEGTEYGVTAECVAGDWCFDCSGERLRVTLDYLDRGHYKIELGDELIELAAIEQGRSILLAWQAQSYRFDLYDPTAVADADAAEADHPRAPMSGAIVALPVAVGDTVAAGDTLVVIEAMKMEHAIVAQAEARVVEVLFATGDQVDEGDTLALLEVDTE